MTLAMSMHHPGASTRNKTLDNEKEKVSRRVVMVDMQK